MNEEYLQSLYDYISSNDSTYQDDVSFEDFKMSMGDRKYAANMYGYITDLDPSYKQDVGIKDFLDNINGQKKKKNRNQTWRMVLWIRSIMKSLSHNL